MRRTLRVLMGATLAAAGAACDRPAIHGTVVDVQGEALPGVAVRAAAGDFETITNGLGQYALAYAPGITGIEFIKNGYTSGRLAIEVAEARSVQARPVALWRLPVWPGVYLYENNRYRTMTPLEPSRFVIKTTNAFLYGVDRLPDMESTLSSEPPIILHHVPAYDVHLCRLRTVEAAPTDGAGASGAVWTGDAPIRVEVLPIDEPERLLLQLRLSEPLTPGVYAVHWGALDGYANTDSRLFVFSVRDAASPEPIPAQPSETPKTKAQPAPRETRPEAADVDTSAVDTEAGDAAQSGY